MDKNKRDFSSEAASWDKDPGRIKLAADVARAISEEIPLSPDMDVLDFGCGTGLLALQLQPHVRSVTGVDNSHGMIAEFKRVIWRGNLFNVSARYKDLDKGDTLEGRYHLVVSSMSLHHVEHIGPLLKKLVGVVVPGGHICVADLDPDGGMFHSSDEGVFHSGFHRPILMRMFADAGLAYVRARTAATAVKPVPGGGTHSFSIFLMTGRKPA